MPSYPRRIKKWKYWRVNRVNEHYKTLLTWVFLNLTTSELSLVMVVMTFQILVPLIARGNYLAFAFVLFVAYLVLLRTHFCTTSGPPLSVRGTELWFLAHSSSSSSKLTAEQQLLSSVGEGEVFDGREAACHSSAQVTRVAERAHR